MGNNNNKSRRYFLDNGIKLGLAAIIGGLGFSKIANQLRANYNNNNNNSREKIELMSTNGNLIQVD